MKNWMVTSWLNGLGMAEDHSSGSRRLYGGLYRHNGQSCSMLVDDANVV